MSLLKVLIAYYVTSGCIAYRLKQSNSSVSSCRQPSNSSKANFCEYFLNLLILLQLSEATDTMSTKYGLAGYNNSRKHISISIPSSTEVMSPHIKSVEELRVLGINLSSFGAPTQFFICVVGVFIFYLIYGYLQVSGRKLQ